jgi:hypothetical protein
MPQIDARIFPLLETLAGAGLDWPVVEVMHDIQQGMLPEKSELALETARRRAAIPDSYEWAEPGEDAATPSYLQGNGQLQWAVGLISERLENAVESLRLSLASSGPTELLASQIHRCKHARF